MRQIKNPEHRMIVARLGHDYHEIAAKIGHGVTYYMVRDWWRRGFIPYHWAAHVANAFDIDVMEICQAVAVDQHEPSKKSASSKLNQKQINVLRAMHEEGKFSLRQIASVFGISHTHAATVIDSDLSRPEPVDAEAPN